MSYCKPFFCVILILLHLSSITLAGLSPHFSDERAVPLGRFTDESHQKSNTCLQHAKKVSFEDYLLLWKGIATSNPSGITPNPFKELLKKDDKLQNAHFGLSQDELKQEIRLQLAEHNKVMYGNFNWNDEYSSTDIKSSKIQVLKQVSSSKPSEFLF